MGRRRSRRGRPRRADDVVVRVFRLLVGRPPAAQRRRRPAHGAAVFDAGLHGTAVYLGLVKRLPVKRRLVRRFGGAQRLGDVFVFVVVGAAAAAAAAQLWVFAEEARIVAAPLVRMVEKRLVEERGRRPLAQDELGRADEDRLGLAPVSPQKLAKRLPRQFAELAKRLPPPLPRLAADAAAAAARLLPGAAARFGGVATFGFSRHLRPVAARPQTQTAHVPRRPKRRRAKVAADCRRARTFGIPAHRRRVHARRQSGHDRHGRRAPKRMGPRLERPKRLDARGHAAAAAGQPVRLGARVAGERVQPRVHQRVGGFNLDAAGQLPLYIRHEDARKPPRRHLHRIRIHATPPLPRRRRLKRLRHQLAPQSAAAAAARLRTRRAPLGAFVFEEGLPSARPHLSVGAGVGGRARRRRSRAPRVDPPARRAAAADAVALVARSGRRGVWRLRGLCELRRPRPRRPLCKARRLLKARRLRARVPPGFVSGGDARPTQGPRPRRPRRLRRERGHLLQ
mmetsp:Transcript_21778/g.75325  ORF Transcript_21778/g.75325 Transcript_21778/m.75325 type:complete len:510 (+) Transcript_21778:446-1975(+)